MGINHICMDWEPFMLPYRAGQFFVGATLWMYPGPKGDRQNYLGLGQIKAYNAITGKYKWEKMERFAVWGGTLATAGNLVFYGTLDGYHQGAQHRHRRAALEVQAAVRRHRPPDDLRAQGHAVRRHLYGVGGWPGVGLVFDLQDPTAGLGAVGAFKNLPTTPRWVAA